MLKLETVLGLYNQRSARRLARLLLADALSSEGAWEEELETVGQDDNRGLVLRYTLAIVRVISTMLM